MIYMTDGADASKKEDWKVWYIGDPVPQVSKDKTVYFQATGAELMLVLAAMEGINSTVADRLKVPR